MRALVLAVLAAEVVFGAFFLYAWLVDEAVPVEVVNETPYTDAWLVYLNGIVFYEGRLTDVEESIAFDPDLWRRVENNELPRGCLRDG